MTAVSSAAWSVDSEGFHVDARWADAGYKGGVTNRAMGDMAQASARQRALEKAGLGHLPAYDLKQVHGNAVHDVHKAGSEKRDGDGWLVYDPGRVALIYAADCTPIFLWDSRGKAAAVLHSGWKGTKADIAAEGVKALVGRGAKPAHVFAAIGPRIGACCYAVGEEFQEWARASSLERRGGKLYFDLGAEIRSQLGAAGLHHENISVSPACTCCGAEFWSFRRDKQSTRMIGFLARHV